jgi:hypothetical protein
MQTILSFDVDRTLIDRNRHTHSTSERIKKALLLADDAEHITVLLNTGRDLGALQEFDAEVGRPLDAFYLSGRCERIDSTIKVNEEAILPIDLVSILFEKAAKLGIPFLDLKSGTSVIKIQFIDSGLPFGFQKPLDWYRCYKPMIINASCPGALEEIESFMPLRLEVPIRLENLDSVREELSLRYSLDTQAILPHLDFLDAYDSAVRGWGILQLVSPISKINKGTSLAEFVKRYDKNVRIVHFGDSDRDHNSDALVKKIIPHSEYINIEWKHGSESLIEEQIVTKIEEYL